ncbi:cell wall hydrolase [Sphingomonas sp.]|uniref:cell wall hydrolase n=1 Tax=Sphingomonas sp. TaxID=28214 RepID=UPI003B00F81E
MPLLRHVTRLLGAFFLIAGVSPALADDEPGTRTVAATIAAPLPTPAAAASPKTLFASLAAAVAAQDGTASDEHLRCLAGAVYFESQGQPLAGQFAVARVILNRIRSGRFASSVCGVVLQRGQFGFVRGGAIPAIDATRSAYRTAIAVAKVALTEAWTTTTAGGALYFNGVRARRVGGQRIAVIGGHAFYR